MNKIRLALGSAVVAALLAVASLAAVQPAGAAFPGNNGQIVYVKNQGSGFAGDIYKMNPDGSNPQLLTSSPKYDEEPTWSPNGKRIAFDSNRSGTYQIYVMDPDGTDVKRVTSGAGGSSQPAWSPGGNEIAFSMRDRGGCSIYRIKLDGTGLRAVTATDNACEEHPNWSADGGRIAYSRYSSSTNTTSINTIAPGGGAPVTLKRLSLNDFEVYLEDPDFSPDGRRILYLQDETNSNQYRYLRTMNSRTGESVSQVGSTGILEPGAGAFSPDGARVYFGAYDASSDGGGIYAHNSYGAGEPVKISDFGYDPDVQPRR